MSGDNCSVFGRGTRRRTKGVGIWKLPKAKNEDHKKRREDLLAEIYEDKRNQSRLKEKVGNDKVFTCEKYFHPENIETCK